MAIQSPYLLEFLQIWTEPNVTGIKPGYQQKMFDKQPGLQLIASADARDNSLKLHQDASLYQLLLENDETCHYDLNKQRTVYIHVVAGQLQVDDIQLNEGDGATIKNTERVTFSGNTQCEALLFDLP